MAGTKTKEEFANDEYNEHYREHRFNPIADATNAHRILARVKWVMDFVEEKQIKSVLDLGCLDGYTLLTLEHHHGITGTGVDLSREGIEIARERNGDRENLTFVSASIEDFLEASDEKYELITMFEVIEHVLDPSRIINLMETALEPGGSVMITTPDYDGPYGKENYDPLHVRIYTAYNGHKAEDAIPIQSIIPNGKRATTLLVEDGLIHLRY